MFKKKKKHLNVNKPNNFLDSPNKFIISNIVSHKIIVQSSNSLQDVRYRSIIFEIRLTYYDNSNFVGESNDDFIREELLLNL